MMKKTIYLISLVALSIFGIIAVSEAIDSKKPDAEGKNPFNEMTDRTLALFRPLFGNVISVEGAIIYTDITEKSGLAKGMRLSIQRESSTYRHPITGAEVAKLDSSVGIAVVVEFVPKGARLKLISGEAKKGDGARLSSAKVRVLFAQERGMSWGIAEEYHDSLTETGRFYINDLPFGVSGEKPITSEASKYKADVVILISEERAEDAFIFRQKLLWADDLSVIDIHDVRIDKEYAKELKFGEELFKPKDNDLQKAYDLPLKVRLMARGDIDGEGNNTFAMSDGRIISFFRWDKSFKAALGGLSITDISAYQVAIEIFDIDKDGRDEILVVTQKSDSFETLIYGYKDGKFENKGNKDFFMSVSGGRLFGQRFTAGTLQPVFEIEPGSIKESPTSIALPAGVGVNDFVYTDSGSSAYNEAGNIGFYDKTGKLLLLSNATSAVNSDRTVSVAGKDISIRTRMYSIGNKVVRMESDYTNELHSSVKGLIFTTESVAERTLADDIPGRVEAFVMDDENFFIAVSDAKMRNAFKGKSTTGSRIFVFPRPIF